MARKFDIDLGPVIGAVIIAAATLFGILYKPEPKIPQARSSSEENITSSKEDVTTDQKKIRWKGRTVGELVEHIGGGEFGRDIQIRLAVRVEKLNYLLVDEVGIARTFQGSNVRDLLVSVCRELETCLICAWSGRGDSVTLDIKSDCTERYYQGPYYQCRRQC